MNVLIRAIERLVGLVGIAAALLIVPLVLATCWEVFSRYAAGAPTVWAYEVGYILTGSHFLLGLAYTLREGLHIRIDIFTGSMSPRTRAAIDAVTYAVVLPLLVWLAWMLGQYLVAGYARGERSGQSALNLPVWPFRLVFTLSFAMFALQVLAELLKSIGTIRTPAPAVPAPGTTAATAAAGAATSATPASAALDR
ncbi:MAG TPA: TRAP transporter small permease subunit [Burkholderiaceae bacterium]|nr:TRAP transporter small permease subunit [Burkholderiaceae bacterium]